MIRAKLSRKLDIFQRALRRHSQEKAKAFTERVIRRWIKHGVGDDFIERYTQDGYVEYYQSTNFLKRI